MKKIQEDYSMFDEQVDDELEDIIEQPIEEESGSGESEDENDGLQGAGGMSGMRVRCNHW